MRQVQKDRVQDLPRCTMVSGVRRGAMISTCGGGVRDVGVVK